MEEWTLDTPPEGVHAVCTISMLVQTPDWVVIRGQVNASNYILAHGWVLCQRLIPLLPLVRLQRPELLSRTVCERT